MKNVIKKIFYSNIIVISSIIILLFSSKQSLATASNKKYNYSNEISLTSNNYYVYTPRKTAVLVYKFSEMSNSEIINCNAEGDMLVPEATRIAPSSNIYNCHSYAWYSQTTTNEYWMPDPSNYYTDYSYDETSTPKVGDKICYFSKNGENKHSGIIIGINSASSNNVCGNSNLYQVRSKWGSWGLYEHRGDQCPYTSTYGGECTYVKYYTVHTHNYNLNYKWKSDTMHYATCRCNYTTTMGHVISTSSYNSNRGYATCLLCKGNVKIGILEASTVSNLPTNSFKLPNGVIVISDSDYDAYLKGNFDLNSIK